ncbi:FecR domain-containing protein [uncultured Draconibacterium sp.]|uniref:FecR family protein n=1 Tax=uncultured Draconibacterium sp. TaxID=1573823 RepID=UPI0029C00710|nr:FecR domain-containing protein [uncultured Draconibacterium sp.]
MKSYKFWESVSRKIAGEATGKDHANVQEWMEEEYNENVYERLVQIWKFNPIQTQDTSNIYRKVQYRKKQYGNNNVVSLFKYYGLRISAILIFLVFSTFVVHYFYATSNNSVIYQEISVSKGSRSYFNLSDGTKVWLSNNSTIRFPSSFTGKTRELEIEGEAYFEVAHNRQKPFIVNLGENRIKVLGTKFSVIAYPNDKIVRTDLIEGEIQFDIAKVSGDFESFILKPSHSLIFDKTSGKLYEDKVPDGFYDYWQKGIYEFRNETLEDLAVKIDRIYNTQIVFEDESLKKKRFSGTISIDDNIFTFIEAVKSISIDPITYRYTENKLYINTKE